MMENHKSYLISPEAVKVSALQEEYLQDLSDATAANGEIDAVQMRRIEDMRMMRLLEVVSELEVRLINLENGGQN